MCTAFIMLLVESCGRKRFAFFKFKPFCYLYIQFQCMLNCLEMAISTNSIIHYTNSFDVLCAIVNEGFKVKYCSEHLFLGRAGGSMAAHPMVSFCDIPLSHSRQHFESYGKYGIGLTKEWAFRMQVNPVLYIDRNSLLAESIYELIKARRSGASSNLSKEQKAQILQIKSYAKNYTGDLIRHGKKLRRDYKFYDEREWRLVPKPQDMENAPFSVSVKNYEADKDKYNSRISHIKLEFKAEDISYIIVERIDEIPKMVKRLRSYYSNRITSDALDILLSKICSAEQILSDY